MNRKSALWFAVLAALGAAALASPRQAIAHPDGTFPRTFNLDWKNNADALRDSKYDVVSLSARAATAKWDSIKALNPSCKRLAML